MYNYIINEKTPNDYILRRHRKSSCAEMQGFEPWRRLRGLAHFECAPFGHLGTSPKEKDESLRFHPHAGSRGRTDTAVTSHGILSPERLPIPPYRQYSIS